MDQQAFTPVQFGRYELSEKLATGGMAEIFKATSRGAHGFEKTFVVKRILPQLAQDPEFLRMFIAEAKVMVQLTHPKVVQVLDFGEHLNQPFIVMEYVKGIDCLAMLRKCAHLQRRPTTAIAVHIVAEVLDALEYAHNLTSAHGEPLGILHRDISPSNIFVSEQGEVKLGDFGIAVALSAQAQGGTRMLRGKYGYMAPEVVAGGTVDHRADIFSVGVVLAELLMIRRLFVATSDLELLLQVRDANLHRLDKYGQHIPEDLQVILRAALTRDPQNRYQDAASFRDALHRYLFDQRLMVRGSDVRRFITRMLEVDTTKPILAPESALAPDTAVLDTTPSHLRPVLAADQNNGGEADIHIATRPGCTNEKEVQQNLPPAVVGRRRKITMGPPPRPEPVPSGLAEVDEESRITTDDALAAVSEVGETTTGSLRDFRTMETGERPPTPAGQPLVMSESGRAVPSCLLPQSDSSLPEPTLQGELAQRSIANLLFRFAVDEETGLLKLKLGETIKEVYLVDGDPQYVSSNLPEELFGQYLVRRGVISEGELAMALAMLPHFNGKIGNTLVGLNLLRPMQVLRHLTHQVRQKLLQAFAWEGGSYAYYRGTRCQQQAAPLGLDAFEMIGAGVAQLPAQLLEQRMAMLAERYLQAVSPTPVPPEIFRMGSSVREIYDKLDGRHRLGEHLARFDDQEQRHLFIRVVYLLVETGLATLRP